MNHTNIQFSEDVSRARKSNELRETYGKLQRSSASFNDSFNQLSAIDEDYSQSNFLPTTSLEKVKKKPKNSLRVVYSFRTLTTESRFYCSTNYDRLSESSIDSLSPTHSRRSSFSSYATDAQHQQRAPLIVSSIDVASSTIFSSNNKNRLSSLEFNSSLSEFERKKLNDISQ